MDCDDVRDFLDQYVAGELSRSEAKLVAEHISECPACELECEEVRELAVALRHARDSIRPLRAFEIPVEQLAPARRWRAVWGLGVAVLTVWMVFLTTAMLWPSLARQLTFLPVGSNLRSAATRSPSATASTIATGNSLAQLPTSAISEVVRLFASSSRSDAYSDPTARWLGSALPPTQEMQHATVQLVALGPLVSANQQEVELAATADIFPAAKTGPLSPSVGSGQLPSPTPLRYEFLITLSKSAKGQWAVSKVTVLTGPG